MTVGGVRAIGEALTLLLALGLAAVRERQERGIEALLIAMGLALLGPLARRVLVALGRAEPAPFVLTVFELLAFGAFTSYPPAGWGLGLLGLSALWHAAPRAGSANLDLPRSHVLEEGLVAVLAGLAFVPALSNPPLRVPLAVLLIEAYGPGAPRDARAGQRRLAGFALAAALSYVYGYEMGEQHYAWPHGEDLLLGVAFALAGLLLRPILERPRAAVETPVALRRYARLTLRATLAATAGIAIVLASSPSVVTPKLLDGILVANACVLFGAWRAGAARLGGRSPSRVRAATLFLTVTVLMAGAHSRWNRLFLAIDTESYVTHASMRTVLYPTFIDALDARHGSPYVPEVYEDPREMPGHRFLAIPRAQKLFLVASIGALLWALTASINSWTVLLLVGIAVLTDLGRWRDGSIARNVDSVLTEGLNHSFVFAFMAAVASYFLNPSRWKVLVIGLLLAVMNLTRPANVAFLAILPWIALLHVRRDGLRVAALRTGALILVVSAPLLLECGRQYAAHGHFRLHSFTGTNLLDTALQVATPEDVPAQPDPLARELLKICVIDMGNRRCLPNPMGDHVEKNLHILNEAFERLQREGSAPTGLAAPFFADDLFARVAKSLMARHPRGYLELVAYHVRCYLRPGPHLLVVAVCAAGLFAHVRSGSPAMLFVTFFATMPILSMIPAFLFNFPVPRYCSQMLWAEDLAAPLFLVTVAAVGPAAWSRVRQLGREGD